MKLWILLTFLNEYDQHGGYFSGAFDSLEAATSAVDHVGRKDSEYSWYRIVEVELNQLVPAIYDGLNTIDEDQCLG